MGWLFNTSWRGASGKAALIESRIQDESHADGRSWHCVKSALGRVEGDYQALWTVWDRTASDKTVERYIGCDFLSQDEGCWGYKDMTESSGPYAYDCPLSFLAMVPVANQAWRDQVIAHHAQKKQHKQMLANLKPGLVLTFKELTIESAVYLYKHPLKNVLVVEADGKRFAIPPKFFKRIVSAEVGAVV